MPTIDLAKLTKAQLVTMLRTISETAPETEASAHWKTRDLPCVAAKPCDKTFRTTKGRDWHTANVKH